jgi:hypothetical protein
MTPVDQSIIHPGGIDIMVMRGPTLPDIMTALHAACGLSAQDVIGPGEDIMQRLEILQRPLRAEIYALAGGDFDFKVDIDGLTPRNYADLARAFGTALGHGVAILDESKPDPLSAILMRPGAADTHGYIDDAEPDGAVFHPDRTAS